MRAISYQTSNRLTLVFTIIGIVSGIFLCFDSPLLSKAVMQGQPTLADDFNDNSLDTVKWDANNLFSGFTDTSLPIAETNQRLEIGPLLQNTGSSHYRGIRSVNTYNFSDAYSYVELVQAPPATTTADAMFTIGNDVDNYYRLYVEGGTLYGLRKVGGTKTTLFTLSYDTTNHRFLRIRHDAASGNVTLDTAPGSNGVPGTWVQRYSETWNSSISLTSMIFELKGGTWQAEANAPNKVIFDNFQFANNSAPPANPPTVTAISPNAGPTSGGTSVTITGTGFALGATVSLGGSPATSVTVVSSTSITATAPAHAVGTVNVAVTNPDAQSGTLNSGYTYNSGSSETVLLADDFNDNSLDPAKWDANNLFSGLTDTSLPIAETNQRLEIGPLLQNTGSSHYRGIRSVNTYNFSDAYSYVELVQAPPATTTADAMFTIGNDVDNYYRLYVEGGTLYGLRKVGGTKTTLFTLSYDTTNHRFLRIRHDAASGNVTLDTAPGNNGVPGTWVQRYSETWNSSISLTSMIFELKGGTWQAEANAPNKVIFDNFKAAIPDSGSFVSSEAPPTFMERLDPANRTGAGGEDPLSRNFNWNLSLVDLPGRAGLDLSLGLSYNSLVWTKTGNSISFDDDRGFPSPGFRLGFPVIQPLYFNAEVGKRAFLLLGPDGSRTELRQVGTSVLYEAADSSHLLLDSSTMILSTTDGTQLSYVVMGSDFNCTQIKDRNGNYLTINYTSFGRIDTVVDTLGRSIKFNYDTNRWLTSITQVWNGDTNSPHVWATFTYTDTSIQTNFSGLTVYGPANGNNIKTLSRVTLADGSHSDFSYSSWGQVWKVSGFASDNHLLNYRMYDLPQTAGTSYTDCPRFNERRDWAQYWNGDTDGTPATNEEAPTTFGLPVDDSWIMPDGTSYNGTRAQVTAPDGTIQKLYFIRSQPITKCPRGQICLPNSTIPLLWQRGLPALVNTYDSSAVLQRQAMTTWTQDDTTVSYPLNPRVTETNIYDPAGNHARTRTTYQQFTFANGTSCQLPQDFYEYAANAITILRTTHTNYNTSTTYTDRRIIGLASEKYVYDGDVNNGGTLVSKEGFFYDNDNGASSIQGTDAPVQHDNTNYSASFVTGRANLSSVRRYDVTNTAQFTTITSKYNTAGAVVLMADALNHTTQMSYSDSFSDGVARNALAYPTTLTDPDNYTSTTKYNFDFGAVTYRRTPQPNTTQNLPGPEQTITFDTLGRLQQVTNQVNGAYTRYVYSTAGTRTDTYATIQDGLGEAHSFQISDGAGRVIGTATDHPGSTGGYSGQKFVYDVMGRVIKTSNPMETSASGAPAQWNTAGDDDPTVGWIYTQQTYDWKGRPLVTTKQDGATKTASYAGCGCAGGEVVTLTDEGTLQGGVLKTRQQKIYSDVLGRTAKTEVLDWDGTGPGGVGRRIYSATVNTYNARDQITVVRQYAGAEGSGTYQDTTIGYDGYGRQQSKHVPEQDMNTATAWTYNADDSVNTITDARGAITTYGYSGTSRQLVKQITQTLTGSPTITTSFSYDATGNRLSMTDGFGSVSYAYDQLARLTSEMRSFSGVGSFSINYTYNLAGELLSVTDPFGASFSYTRDIQGRLKTVSGSPYAGTTNYVNDVAYRAWGAPKTVSYNGSNSSVSFNARLQPTQFRLTANGSGASIIRENYSYFPDARLNSLTDLDDTAGTNPPVSLRFLSRAYSYDHAGRVSFVYGTGGAGQGVPFNQSYLYDEFDNMTTRSGNYYNYNSSGPATDTANYTNNRRSNWTYNAEGQVLSTPLTSTDRPRTMTYDAADRMITTVQSNQFNTVTYSAAYDGDGQLVYETSNTSPGTSSASYIVRSTVLAGEVLTRLDQFGNKLITHVPAEGLLFATQRSSGAPGAYVDMTFRNPLGITETSKAVYDPLGNYIPFQASSDPRPPVGSYNSGSMSGLSSSEADPSSFGVGCIMDGMPTNCRRVMMIANNGRGNELTIYGLALSPTITRLMLSGTQIPPQSHRIGRSVTVEMPDGKGVTFTMESVELTGSVVIAPGMQEGFEQNPQNTGLDPSVSALVSNALASSDCMEFARTVLNSVSNKKNPVFPTNGSLIDVFNAFLAQGANHSLITRNKPADSWGYGNPVGKIKNGDAAIFSPNGSTTGSDADTVIAELFHLAGQNKYYSDEQLAKAVHNSSYASDAAAVIGPAANIFDKQHYQARGWRKDQAYSAYFHYIQKLHCTAIPQPAGHPRRIN